ncbi:hypothetical protein NSK_000083 [Nannochloropsis salina CCMP1776]|jgi:hypothetical protein|uniref:Inositol polyphosphate-related phosphatase domain-containing protein n=1 Tax=Nannochloropsis salina CCMP1776 TaxID=1027361 RepID=A0A4D9DI31_9STRA|nr:hypothetical protein NSK_000083 [Nannochloropsis salina CCMP1776]|eukprot:TFJ88509.1 hypothetical protein NSK_000083 [Nannochloropsis salina CCMP1776]
MVVGFTGPWYSTEEELYTSRVICATGAIAGLAIIPVAITARHRVFQKRVDLANESVARLFENFLLLKAILDGCLCLILLGGLFMRGDSIGCSFLGFFFQLEEVMTLALIMRMVMHPFHFMLRKRDMTDTKEYFNRSILVCVLVSSFVCIPLAASREFGRSGSLCWLTSVSTQFYAFFTLVFFTWIVSMIVIVRLARVTQHRHAVRLLTVYHGNFFRRLSDGMVTRLVFIGVAVILYGYVFRVLARAYIWRNGAESPFLSGMEMLTIAFRGPVDAIFYSPKDWAVRLARFYRHFFLRQKRGAKRRTSMDLASAAEPVRLTLIGKAYPLPFFTDPPVPSFQDKQLFISTYNLGECKSKALGPEALAAWIPRDRDVYVLGLQECMVYRRLGEDVLAHLGGPARYVMYRRAIGSTYQSLGYHGLIALLVLARTEEVQANRFLLHESKNSAVARGKNLGVTTAQNKGGVGLAFRYYDTTFALLACHLSSDLKGRSRLDKRNQDAWQLTYETNLWREEYLLDVHHQHHVCIFLGDVNYRLRRTDPEKVLEDVASICRRERDVLCGGQEEWRRDRYALLLAPGNGGPGPGEGTPSEGGRKEKDDEVRDSEPCGGVDEPGTLESGGNEGGQREPELLEEDPVDEEAEEVCCEQERQGVSSLVRQVKEYLEPSNTEMAKLTMKRLASSYLSQEGPVEVAARGLDEPGDQDRREARRRTWSARLWSSIRERLWRRPQSSLESAVRHKAEGPDLEEGRRDPGLASGKRRLPGESETGGLQLPLPPPEQRPNLSFSRLRARSHASSWEQLLRDDEMRQGMEKGAIFYGFQEGKIRFPPSYRRIKGPHGECGDYCDVEILKTAYSTVVKEKTLSLKKLNRGLRILAPYYRFLQRDSQGQALEEQSSSRTPSYASSGWESSSTRAFSRSYNGSGVENGEDGRDGEDVSASSRAPAGAKKAQRHATTRIPSYTDRILLHVVEDFKDRIRLGPYEMCDALQGSDHRPVSTLVTARVNVAVRGLNSFHQAKSCLQNPSMVHNRDVITVHDACFYILELTDLRVELLAANQIGIHRAGGSSKHGGDRPAGKGSAPRDEASVFVLFPLDNEDCFSTLRRPAIVAAVSKQIVFLTNKVEYNPFNFFSLMSYCAAKKNGVTVVSCTRMDYGGLHAIFSLRDGRKGQLGTCVIPITSKDGRVQMEQKNAVFPLTVGGCLCGHLFTSVRITQLALDMSTVRT